MSDESGVANVWVRDLTTGHAAPVTTEVISTPKVAMWSDGFHTARIDASGIPRAGWIAIAILGLADTSPKTQRQIAGRRNGLQGFV